MAKRTPEELQLEIKDWKRERVSVSMRQARLALIQQSRLQDIENAISALPEPDQSIVRTEWEYASVVERQSQWVEQMRVILGMTTDEMDTLFALAENL